jgi:hypothetical protein
MKLIFHPLFLLFLISGVLAQKDNPYYSNTITTSVPALTIETDAVSTSMGNISVVAEDDYPWSGINGNPAILSNRTKLWGVSLSSKSWNRALTQDVNFYSLKGYFSLTENLTAGVFSTYFSPGNIIVSGINCSPFDLYSGIRLAYSSDSTFSAGLGLKYIYSDLVNNCISVVPDNYQSARALAGDFGIQYSKRILLNEKSKFRLNFGINILNIGNKIKYLKDTQEGDFMPGQLGAGTMITYNSTFKNQGNFSLSLAYAADKLLVPTPPIYARDSLGNLILDDQGKYVIALGKHPFVSVFGGIIQSFYDAPYGAWEEFNEIRHSVGLGFRIQTSEDLTFFLRGGYKTTHKTKGNIKYLTTGSGIIYKTFTLHFSMLFLKSYQDQFTYSSGNVMLIAEFPFKKSFH